MTAPAPRIGVSLVCGLGLTQIIGYGTLYYSFSILAPAMAADFGWPVASVFGTFSASLLAGGLVAPRVGRLMDACGASRIMVIGSVLAALVLVFSARALTPATYIVSIVAIQMISALVLYNAAFAALVEIGSAGAQRSITHLTLIAGFASTIFWPLTAELHRHLSWREVYLAFAGLNLAICLPVHLWIMGVASRNRDEAARSVTDKPAPAVGIIATNARRRAFLLAASGFAMEGFALAALLIHMVPLLAAVGLGSSAVLVGTLFGPAQVLSRFTNMVFGRGLSPLVLALLSGVFVTAGAATLMVGGHHVAGAVIFAILVGLGSGLASIVQGSLPLHLFGAQGYGEMLGRLAAVRLAVSAAAPFIFAVLLEQYGATAALGAVIVLGSGAIGMFAALGRQPLRQDG